MSRESTTPPTPVDLATDGIRDIWHTLTTIYYANSVSWRMLKAGALLFFGFFLWTGSNILQSVQPGWSFLSYPMAYGFVLIVYGPFHHLVVIPLYQRLRRQGTHLSVGQHLHLPNLSLTVFLILVIVLGTFPVAPMTINFGSTLNNGSSSEIHPELMCSKTTTNEITKIHCQLNQSQGVGRIVVESGGQPLLVDDQPPFKFTLRKAELTDVQGTKQFRVTVLDDQGIVIRRFTRRLWMINEQ